MRNIRVIFVPFCSGANRDGTQYGPMELEKSSPIIQESVRTYLHYDADNLSLCEDITHGVRNYKYVYKMASELRDVVNKSMRDGDSVLVIGGDHSIALGSLAGVLQNDTNLGVIWFDAHGDINTEETSPSANAHGMPIAALLGLCKSGLNDIAKVRLKYSNIYWIGVRSLDDGEKQTLQTLGIDDHVYSADLVHKVGMKAIMDEICYKMHEQQIKHIHISFDVDGMDPSIVYATGTKVPNGLLQTDVDEFINQLIYFPPILSMDFVEYNPMLENKAIPTKQWCLNMLHKLYQQLLYE